MRLLFTLTSLLLAAHASADMTYIGKPGCLIANPYPLENETASWDGGCKDGYADGMGVLNWSLNGKPNGGYEGMMRKGQANGPGFRLLADNATRQGTFKDDQLDGKGIATEADGSKLSATFAHGEPTGIVDYTTVAGDIYHGEWRDGHPHGQGKMTFGTGGSYEGGWTKGELSGKGTITYPNGEQVVHEFVPQPQPAEPIKRPTYSVKQDEPETGTSIRRDGASGFDVPPDMSYAQLTAEQQQLLKQPYKILLDNDEPPYPLHGPEAITRIFMAMQAKVLIDGKFRLSVLIDDDGSPVNVTVLAAPDMELAKVAAGALMLRKYKPARCAGKPCTMRYNYNVCFTLTL